MENMYKKFLSGALALGVATGSVGCAGKTIKNLREENRFEKEQRIMETLKTNRLEDIRILSNGYATTKDTYRTLKTIAGIFSGTIKVKKIPQGYASSGFFSEYKNPKSIGKIAKIIDTNNDKIVTNREGERALNWTYKKFAK